MRFEGRLWKHSLFFFREVYMLLYEPKGMKGEFIMQKFWIRMWLVLAGLSLLPFALLLGTTLLIIWIIYRFKYGMTFSEMWEEAGCGEEFNKLIETVRIIWKHGYYIDV